MESLKKLRIFGVVVLAGAFIIGGCGNFGKNANNANREDALIIKEKEKVGGSLETGNGYGFSSFDLEIDVDGNDAIEINYNVEVKKIESEYVNKLNNVRLEGTQAMDEINKFFMAILITKDTPEQEVIDKILKHLNIEAYSKFDLEVNFDDGTLLDIEVLK